MKKICNKCGVEKEYEHFAKNGQSTRSCCKECEASRSWSQPLKQRIDEEIQKCEILCANCHREEHHKALNRY